MPISSSAKNLPPTSPAPSANSVEPPLPLNAWRRIAESLAPPVKLAQDRASGRTGSMKVKTGLIASVFLAILVSGPARAMSIHDFGRMNLDDQATYLTALVDGTADLLKAQGRREQARQAVAFFKDSSTSGGVHQFALHLKEMESLNNRNATNPNNRAPVYQIEDAMQVTMKHAGIGVSVAYLLTINKDFIQGPLRPEPPP
jgi:hypothetical protein